MINKILNVIKNNPNNILIFIISVFFIALFMYLSKYSCFFGDDSCYAVYLSNDEGIFDCLIGETRKDHGGYYIGLFLCKFLSFGLPGLLGIHPADFIGQGHSFIRSIFTIICLYIISMFSFIYQKKNFLFSILFLFLGCYFFYNGINSNVIVINYNFYRYFFSLIFLGIFLLFIYENIAEENNNKSNQKLLLIGMSGFIIGTSIEINFFTCAFFICLIMFYNYALSFLSFIIKNNNLSQFKYNLNFNFYIPAISLLTGILVFTNSKGFKSIASDRGLSDISLTLNDLKEFMSLYLNVCFKDEFIYWMIFIAAAFIATYFSIKNKEFKKVLFLILLQLSILTVIFSLILCGKTFDEITKDRFYLYHQNIVFLYKMLILYPLLMCINYTVSNILKELNYKSKKIIYSAIAILLILGSLIYTKLIIKDYKNSNLFMQQQKEMYYISEKLFRFYTLRKELPILPNYYKKAQYSMYPYFRGLDINNDIADNFFIEKYYRKVFNENLKKPVRFIIKHNAIEIYKQNGGILTEKELQELNFSNLLNDEFVLNKKPPKF